MLTLFLFHTAGTLLLFSVLASGGPASELSVVSDRRNDLHDVIIICIADSHLIPQTWSLIKGYVLV